MINKKNEKQLLTGVEDVTEIIKLEFNANENPKSRARVFRNRTSM